MSVRWWWWWWYVVVVVVVVWVWGGVCVTRGHHSVLPCMRAWVFRFLCVFAASLCCAASLFSDVLLLVCVCA